MEVKCEYCDAMISDRAAHCPNCGAPNEHIKRMTAKTPQTIEQLESWYAARKLPPYESTRFFIGINYLKPRAFGIYRDGEDVVVYKNKDNGERSVRYRGTDEAYAVNEIYLKLKSEILAQKERKGNRTGSSSGTGARSPKSSKSSPGPKKSRPHGCCIGAFIALAFIVLCFLFIVPPGFKILLVCAGLGLPAVYLILNATVFKKSDDPDRREDRNLKFWIIYAIIMVGLLVVSGIFTDTSPKYYKYDGDVYCKRNGSYYRYEYDKDYDVYDYVPVLTIPYMLEEYPDNYSFDTNSDGWVDAYEYEEDNYGGGYSSGSDDGWDWGSDSDYDWDYGSDYDSDWDSGGWDSGSSDWDSDW